MEQDTIPRNTYISHLIVVAIQDSITASMGTAELTALFGAVVVNILYSSDLFINISQSGIALWTLNQDKESEIKSLAQRIANSNSELQSVRPGTQETHKILISKLVQHGIHLSNNGFNGHTAKEMLRKEFSDQKIFLHCPLLDTDRKYSFEEFHIKYRVKLWSIEQVWMEWGLKRAESHEEDFRKAMKNPGQFQALLQGHFKHGYQLTGLDEEALQGMVIWDVEVRAGDEEVTKDKEWPKHNVSYWNCIVAALALKNSVSGKLSTKQVMNFMERHFLDYKGYSRDKREVSKMRKNISEVCTHNTVYKTMHMVQWMVREESQEEEMDSRGPMKENEDPMENSDKDKLTRKNPLVEDIPRRNPIKRYYKDANDNLHPIDQSWTRERNGVYYKHEISIEAEDLPPEGYYGSCTKRKGL